MSQFLRLAKTDDVKRYFYEDTDEYIELRTEITKKEATGLLKFAPKEEGDIEAGFRFIGRAFRDLIVGWSLKDDDGNPIEPSLEVYEQLGAAPANWIDRTVGRHLRGVLGVEAEEAEGKLDESA